MNTSPIDSYDDAELVFTFGGGSVGMWLFLIAAFLLTVVMVVRMLMVESKHYAEVMADPGARAAAQSALDAQR